MAYNNPDDPYRSNLTDDEIRRQARLESELQADPELAEGPASGAKVAMFASPSPSCWAWFSTD